MSDNKPTMKISSDGTKKWFLNDQLHRKDGPAVEWSSGTKSWYLNGKLHREDGPAIEWADGSKSWYLNGKRHRKDSPAMEGASGSKYWYLNDELHREDGPAVELEDGGNSWYLNGKRHRKDGPAVEYANGDKFWYLNCKEVTEEEVMGNYMYTLLPSLLNEKKSTQEVLDQLADLGQKYDISDNEDLVEGPSHYTRWVIQPITFIMRNGMEFWRGNIIKYASRAGFKMYEGKTQVESEIIDLEKVVRYAQMRINQLNGEETL